MKQKKACKRQVFLKELAKQMILPFMERRANNSNIQKSITYVEEKDKPLNKKTGTRKRCSICRIKKYQICTSCSKQLAFVLAIVVNKDQCMNLCK